ncbi:MAG: endonuclease MutS2 [Campylobacterota bacterium]|nr:endonuclease MutS2 [Campylobacterota bacterium]
MSVDKGAQHFDKLVEQLDLTEHIASLHSFFSRDQSLFLEGDQERHYRYVTALDKLVFKAPPHISFFTITLAHLQKQGVLSFEQIFEVIKLVRYFRYMKNIDDDGIIYQWMEKIVIPEALQEIEKYFSHDGVFDERLDEDLYLLSERIKSHKNDISSSMKRMLYSSKISSYLVDTQIHYLNDEECLLVRGGFSHVLKGAVIGRTGAGFFYVSPDAIMKHKDKIRALTQEKDAIFYMYAKKFSLIMRDLRPFIGFIDKEFNRFDHYQARVHFAMASSLNILKATKDNTITLRGFKHPALHKPKSVDVDFSGKVLMITGVNAGGKTMLLKSILSATLMAKYLIPMTIDRHKSSIGTFKRLDAVIDDPQNVSNDISTFAGRMLHFSKLFEHKSALIGVDEIELGTDSDEAAALFKVILDDLIARGQKIIVTTHHKRLASLMADRDDVELMAAIYDEDRRLPTYEFLHGIIGKSYAFETAQRYGIKGGIVERAKAVYGDNHEKLNQLIERGSELERSLKKKHANLDSKLEEVREREINLKEQQEHYNNELVRERRELQNIYNEAIKEARDAAKLNDPAAIHRQMNKAKNRLPEQKKEVNIAAYEFKVGDAVKYRKQQGKIVSLKSKDAMVEIEGMRVRVKLRDLKLSIAPKKRPKVEVRNDAPKRSGLKLDLHGLRAEEAVERLDVFISDALIQGWDEVIVYHGIGTGKLSYAVKNFLAQHPSVKGFNDAPPQYGGFGAKIVVL